MQALKPPEGRNAQIVMTWLGVISITMFLGITYLAFDFGIVPGGDETVVSKIAHRVFGTGVPYYCVQAATLLILVLAANTSYADFPRLSSILSRDRQGDRLVFSNGILILSGFAILLIVVFQGDTHALLPLYAIGVFISFTLSQGGMVRRWLSLREKGWRWRVWVNGVGAVVTFLVLLTLSLTKFVEGAWIVVVVIPLLVGAFVVMHRHYEEVAGDLSLEGFAGPPQFRHTVLVLIGDVHRGVVRAVQYAKTLAPEATVRAVYVETDPANTRRIEEKWARWGLGVPLVVLTSPYRSLLRPFLDYLDQIQGRGDDQMVTIVLPEFLPRKWWQHFLHNQTALLIKGALLFRRNTVVADVPYLCSGVRLGRVHEPLEVLRPLELRLGRVERQALLHHGELEQLRPILDGQVPVLHDVAPVLRGRIERRTQKKFCGLVAQLVEQCPFKALVQGSSPCQPTIFYIAEGSYFWG